MTDKGHYYEVQVSTVFSTLELSTAIGRARKVVAVVDAGFSKKNEVSYGIEEEDSNCLRKDYTEIAKELGKESKEVVTRAKELGFDVKSHASSVDTDVAEKLIKSFATKKKNSRKESSRSGCQDNGCRREKKAAPVKKRRSN